MSERHRSAARVDPLAPLGLNLAGGATEIHLVRHADAVRSDAAPAADGAAGRAPVASDEYAAYEGHALSERGRAQAAATAQHFAALDIAAVYASPVRRAVETAQAIASRRGTDVVTDDGLREVELGRMDGAMTMRERLDALAVIAIRDGSWQAIPDTEPSRTVRARMLGALDAIAARHPGARVVVVSHAGSINALLGEVAGTPHDFIFPLANASISIVRVNSGRRLLMNANDTAHLRTPERHQ